jgi:hypothetical protein
VRSLIVDIRISRDEYLKVYQSYVRQVRAVARSGESVRFPISVLQPYLTHTGVQGSFCLSFDDHYKFVGIELLS